MICPNIGHNVSQIYLGFLFNIYNKIDTNMKYIKTPQQLNEATENLNISDVSVSLPFVKDWSNIQEEAYDECINELINDDAPITAFIEWLQKKYPNGVKVN